MAGNETIGQGVCVDCKEHAAKFSLRCLECYDKMVQIGKTFEAADEKIDHPPHYGGADNPYEAIKIIEALGLDFTLGNCLKYIIRAGKKGDAITDLSKAAWYLNRRIEQLEREKKG